MKQVVYVDVLVALNIIISFLMIKSVCCLSREKAKVWRVLVGSAMGGIYSLSVFLPPLNTVLVLAVRTVFMLAVAMVVFGFGSIRRFFRCFSLLLAVTLLFAGVTVGVWFAFRPNGLLIRNGSVYLDVSFLTVVILGTVLYAAIRVFGHFLSRRYKDESSANITLSYKGKTVKAKGLIDTGNNLSDSFTGKPVSVIDQTLALELLPSDYAAAVMSPIRSELPPGMHLIVSDTVGGTVLMCAFSADSLEVAVGDGTAFIESAAVAVSSQTKFSSGYSVLLNADTINNINGGRKHGKKTVLADKDVRCKVQRPRGTLHKRTADFAAAADIATRENNNGTY